MDKKKKTKSLITCMFVHSFMYVYALFDVSKISQDINNKESKRTSNGTCKQANKQTNEMIWLYDSFSSKFTKNKI